MYLHFCGKISSTSEQSAFQKLFTYIFAQGCEWLAIVGVETEPRAVRVWLHSWTTSTTRTFGDSNNKA